MIQDSPRIRFLGAAGTVTGSRYLLSFGEKKILVDCGLFQGLKELRLKNWDRFPIDPASIDCVILTHAHIDHSGFIPRLVKEGFRGKVYCTPGTKALCNILLLDAAYLQEEEAQYMNKRKASKHHPALPLFTQEDAKRSLEHFEARPINNAFVVSEDFRIQFLEAGHILGASAVMVEFGGKKIFFSGDQGRPKDPVYFTPARMPEVDTLVVESTYGNRHHPDNDPKEDLLRILEEAFAKKSVVIIPAFAVGRVQTVLHFLAELKREKRLPPFPIFLNSPMATEATKIFAEFVGAHRLNVDACNELAAVATNIRSAEESKSLNSRHGPMLIISASGMATGGRVLHHLQAFAGDPNNLILLTGFQSAGTRGRALLEGAKEIRIFGQPLTIRAQVKELANLSAHADVDDILHWLAQAESTPRTCYITHGEPSAAEAMAAAIREKLHWNIVIPKQDQEFLL